MVFATVLSWVADVFGLSGPIRPGFGTMSARFGEATLVAGTFTENNVLLGLGAAQTMLVSRKQSGGVIGDLRITDSGANIVITSANAGDTSTVEWAIFTN